MTAQPNSSDHSTDAKGRSRGLLHFLGYWAPTALAWCMTRPLLRIRTAGLENLPCDKPFLLVCNHISHFDPPLLASVLPRRVAWVVALDMFAHPAAAAFFRGIDAIPVDRDQTDRRAARETVRRLRSGMPVGLFPEGGIRSGAQSILGGQPMDPGLGTIAALGRVPVIPAILLGTDKLYCRTAWFPGRTSIDFRFGSAIALDSDSPAARLALADRVAVEMRRLLEATRQERGLTDADLPKTAQERWTAQPR